MYGHVVRVAWQRTVKFAKRELLLAALVGLACYLVLPLYARLAGKEAAWSEASSILVGVAGVVAAAVLAFVVHLFLAPWYILRAVYDRLTACETENEELRERITTAARRRTLARKLREYLPLFAGWKSLAASATRDEANLKMTRDRVRGGFEMVAFELRGTEWEEELGFPSEHDWKSVDEYAGLIEALAGYSPLHNYESDFQRIIKDIDRFEDRIRHILRSIEACGLTVEGEAASS